MGRPHTTKPRSAFAWRLVHAREAFGTDQKQFAALLQIGGEAYRRYERGETEPNLSTLGKIRTLTGAPLDWLIAGIEQRQGEAA